MTHDEMEVPPGLDFPVKCFGCGKCRLGRINGDEHPGGVFFCSPTCALRWAMRLPLDDPLWEGVPLENAATERFFSAPIKAGGADPGEWRRISGPPREGVFVQHPHCMALPPPHEPGAAAQNHWGNWGPPVNGVAKESDWPVEPLRLEGFKQSDLDGFASKPIEMPKVWGYTNFPSRTTLTPPEPPADEPVVRDAE